MQFIATDLAKKGLSVRKLSENEYEILYKGTSIFAGKDSEVAGFLKKYFWKTERQLDEVLVGGANKKLYSLWKINLKEGKYNCANTSIATDATLAVRPTSALPYTIQKRFRNGKWENYASFEDGTEFLVLEKEFNAKFSKWTENLDDLIRDLKPDKRGIIFGVKKGKNMGHYFNVINENGVVKFLDGQTGKRAKLVYDYYQFLPTN